MLQKIIAYIREYHMIEAGDHVLAGVSGGADSVCLLLVLLKLRGQLGHTVSAVHVEHGIRGAESEADAAFVERLCDAHGVNCTVCHQNVPEYAAGHGMGEEEAGRRLRYEIFENERRRLLAAGKYADIKIAVAHNINDNAETMLFHLARGTGISGLAGIAPVRGNIIRPLLCVGREEIERFLLENGQDFRTDATNGEDRYSRNRIRHTALPSLTQVNARAPEHMYRTAQELREIDEYMRELAERELADCCRYMPGGAAVNGERFCLLNPVIRREILHLLLAALAGSSRDITAGHVRQAEELFSRQVGRRIDLPYGIHAVRVYEGVRFFTGRRTQEETEKPGRDEAAAFSYEIRKKQDRIDVIEQISKNKYTKCFDYDKIKNGFCIRNRQPGDYLVINDAGERQKLKKYFINEKIPEKERETVLLLADGAHIMWIVGRRTSSYYKVGKDTKRILQVTFYGGKEDEGTDSCNVL